VDFDTVADELYGLALDEFIATRTARVKQARGEGDRALADLIGSLRKPTVSGWLTNQLVRSHRDELDLLLDLGQELREVMGDVGGAELRELTKQRYQLVSALVQQARSLASKRGRPASDDVAQAVRTTLEATLSDDESAEQVRAGRLLDALQVSGFGASGPGAVRPQPRAAPAAPVDDSVSDLDAQRRRHARKLAQRDVDHAEAAVQKAAKSAERATELSRSSQQEVAVAQETVDRLRAELDAAVAEVQTREEQAGQAQDDVERAASEVQVAEADLGAARARLAELDGASD
jgi:vacuolar-type H+-ATPase subunit I/STV1